MKKIFSIVALSFAMICTVSCGDDKKSDSNDKKNAPNDNGEAPTAVDGNASAGVQGRRNATVVDDNASAGVQGRRTATESRQANRPSEQIQPREQQSNDSYFSSRSGASAESNVEKAKSIIRQMIALVNEYKEAERQMDELKAEKVIRQCAQLQSEAKELDSKLTRDDKKEIEKFGNFVESQIDEDAAERMAEHAKYLRIPLDF